MEIRTSKRVAALPGYAFAQVRAQVRALRERGVDVIDFGIGDPEDPTPSAIRQACQAAIEEHAVSGYPTYTGGDRFRQAAASWVTRRFGVTLDPRQQVASTIGAKEAIFHTALALLDPGDLVIAPSPGYPPYARGAHFAGAEVWSYPVTAENDFLPDLPAIVPAEIAQRARAVWLCTPHAPTGRVAPKAWLERVIDWAHAHHMAVLCDEPYTELWLGEDASPPTSALEVTTEGVMVFQSLSKRSTMTGYRVGFVAGDARLVQALVKVKTNADTGTPWFVQEAAIAALEDEAHVVAARERYRQRAKALLEGLMSVGLQATAPEASIYIWQRLPEGVCDVAFAKRLLDPQVAIACTPGSWLAEPTADGENPGKGYVRFALVPTLDRHQEAAERLRAHVRVAEMVGAKR